MRIHVTSGQLLNQILQERYPGECFLPFNEAMITGGYTAKLFSDAFCVERAKVHKVSVSSYKETMKPFLELLQNLDHYDELVLWFGDEPFCIENRKVIRRVLADYGFFGNVVLNIVDENTGEILETGGNELL